MAKKINSIIKAYNLKNGEKRYQFQIYIGIDPLTGKQQRTTRRGFKTKKEAELDLARIKLEISKGTFRKIQAETFEEIFNLWIQHYEKTVEQSTFTKTSTIFKKHIIPLLGEYKIEKISVEICQQCVNKWSTKLKKFRVVKSYASKVFDFAMKRDYILSNPFTLVEIPRIKKNSFTDQETEKENFYTREELIHFLNCLEKEDNFKAYTLFRLLAFSGMRKGEALALTWNDINFTNQEIKINKAISRGKNNKLYIKSTKTGIARTIKMDNQTLEILKNWKESQKQDYLSIGYNTLQKDQLVFSNEKNEFLQPTKTRKWILQAQKKYHLKQITTHGLRHTHCSLLFEAGASIKEVQDRLGHSDIKTTMDIYTHVTQKAKEEAIQKFESYLQM
ncbi:tyrosine-type recombinase/integrase [Bacillus sp. TH44]|uniref:site-specific integrase n=1 Tax=Bacillus TaxID=1386 RepID=UPI00191249B1|nr:MULTISPECIES: site-specific integrase [Bacillus]MBK5361823.1 tyrosine-type recombinase/integrase [Bacillus sp. TH44]MBK5348534.1 tyrosine-type recombinase/integrase [Bacillus sp. TH45]MBK5364566.1 tyrosine-type recombinase/integrase [Bacillus sp. TH50]MDF9527316.1 site-specific integrase [Bacillus cereus]MDG1575632.1 site-specific integrase [Bacillus cereus]